MSSRKRRVRNRSGTGQDLGPVVRDHDGVLGVSCQRAVSGDDGPTVVELVDGVVCAMNAERAVHWKTKLAAAVAFLAAVRRAKLPCHVVPDGASVVVDEATTYEPDAIVYCGDEVDAASLVVPSPLIVVEVISPSTGHIDKGDKLDFTNIVEVADAAWQPALASVAIAFVLLVAGERALRRGPA